VIGDPATTFPDKEFQLGPGPWKVKYAHVGHTHNIFPVNGNAGTFEMMPNSGEIFFIPTPSQWIGFLTGAGSSEHMWYDDALLDEVINDDNYLEIKELILEHESVVQTAIGE